MGRITSKRVRTVLGRIGIAQLLSFVMSLTGMLTTKMLEKGTSYPVLQSATSYLAILLVYMPLYVYSRHHYHNQVFSNFTFMHRWWKYVIQAIIDLEANYLIVRAYVFTTMLSAQLLNCMTLPSAMVLSYFILRMRFSLTHIAGAAIAMGGLCMLVITDADGVTREGEGLHPLAGDFMCVAATVLYASSNVLMEWFIKLSPAQNSNSAVLTELPERPAAPKSPRALDKEEKAVNTAPVEQDRSAANADDEATAVEGGGQVGPAPMVIPVIENLAFLSLAGFIFAMVQFYFLEYSNLRRDSENWDMEAAGYQIAFSVSMLAVYTLLPIVFLSSSAAFANVSLMTTVMYGIVWSVSMFDIYPKKLFIASYLMTAVGIVLYDMSDLSFLRRYGSWFYPCGRPENQLDH